MPNFLISVGRAETYTVMHVEADNVDDARDLALSSDKLNAADWLVSDGNVIDSDDCMIYNVEELPPDETPPPTHADILAAAAAGYRVVSYYGPRYDGAPDSICYGIKAPDDTDADDGLYFYVADAWTAAARLHKLAMKLAAEAKPKLRATFYDANGIEVETVEGDPQEVADKAARFMVLHGSDPDENGAAAAPGRVAFSPLNPSLRDSCDSLSVNNRRP